jgi:hypothetical protein
MRPTAWARFLAVFLLAVGAYNGLSVARAHAAKWQTTERLPWVIVGQSTNEEEAVQQALDKAQAKVDQYLRAQNPPVEWSIDRGYLQHNLWVNVEVDDAAVKAKMKPADEWKDAEKKTILGHTVQVVTVEYPDGKVVRAAILINITDEHRKEFKRQEQIYQSKQRQDRATKRQSVLIRLLAGLVAILTAVACYLRLEDATKGYYTTLLRAAAVVFVALIGAGILLLT